VVDLDSHQIDLVALDPKPGNSNIMEIAARTSALPSPIGATAARRERRRLLGMEVPALRPRDSRVLLRSPRLGSVEWDGSQCHGWDCGPCFHAVRIIKMDK
jgi:hypothetical protein